MCHQTSFSLESERMLLMHRNQKLIFNENYYFKLKIRFMTAATSKKYCT